MNKHFSMSMGRIVLAVFVCLFGMNNLLAQTAVLQHEGEMSMFYGPDSFVAAYNAAVDEDVITLSEGNYHVCDINKSITIHGASAYPDTVAGSFATVFASSLTIGTVQTIEGICFGTVALTGLSGSVFLKCSFEHIGLGHGNPQNVTFNNCYIDSFDLKWVWSHYVNGHTEYTTYIMDNMHFVNSVVWLLDQFAGQNHVVSNSIIRTEGSMDSFASYNSIIIRGDGGKPTNTCTFYNCIGVNNGNEGLFFENSLNSTVMEVDNITDVFPAFVGEDIFNEEFILDEGIASSFLGNNGTEVGIHGGYYPYNNRPSYMRMQHCTVGDRTTDDGHLSVDIEVVTEEP